MGCPYFDYINHFTPMLHVYTHWKRQKTRGLLTHFKGYKNGTLAWNELRILESAFLSKQRFLGNQIYFKKEPVLSGPLQLLCQYIRTQQNKKMCVEDATLRFSQRIDYIEMINNK